MTVLARLSPERFQKARQSADSCALIVPVRTAIPFDMQ